MSDLSGTTKSFDEWISEFESLARRQVEGTASAVRSSVRSAVRSLARSAVRLSARPRLRSERADRSRSLASGPFSQPREAATWPNKVIYRSSVSSSIRTISMQAGRSVYNLARS